MLGRRMCESWSCAEARWSPISPRRIRGRRCRFEASVRGVAISALGCDVLPESKLQFPLRHLVWRGLEVSTAVNCFRTLLPLWWCGRDKGDGEFSDGVRWNLKLFLKRERLCLRERGEFGFGFGLKSETFGDNSVIV